MNVLCLKLRNRHAVWNPATSPPYFEDSIPSDLSYSSIQKKLALKGFHRKKSKPPRKMSPPLPITEDTPPDMLAGAMDLHVVLPNGQDIKMSVERSTPMMDLLVHITTTNKISPGGHIIQAIGDRGVLPYKPSTPIGALDTWTIHIVPKKQTGIMYLKKPLLKLNNQNTPFEQTFRLQVNLPRNQLYVSRVSFKTRLQDILHEVCKEKNLDQSKYCLVHPEKLDEELNLSHTFLDCKLQQVTLLSKSNRPVGLSSVDIMALKRYDSGNQHVNNKYYASHSYDGSVSSGSLEGRSLSPVRSDESSSSPTISKTNALLSRPFRKRRPAPKPPSMQNRQETNHVSESLTISHSRNSSDSSGYHESSVLSESPESNTNSLADSLPRRSKLPTDNRRSENISQHPMPNSRNAKISTTLSRSLSNLAVVDDGKKPSKLFLSNGMRHKEYSASSLSLANIPERKKKAPAPPPPASRSLLSLKEEDVPSGLVKSCAPSQPMLKCQTLPVTTNSSMCDAEINCSSNRLQNKKEGSSSSRTVDSCSFIQNPPVDEIDSLTVSAKNTGNKRFRNTVLLKVLKSGKCALVPPNILNNDGNDCTLRRKNKLQKTNDIVHEKIINSPSTSDEKKTMANVANRNKNQLDRNYSCCNYKIDNIKRKYEPFNSETSTLKKNCVFKVYDEIYKNSADSSICVPPSNSPSSKNSENVPPRNQENVINVINNLQAVSEKSESDESKSIKYENLDNISVEENTNVGNDLQNENKANDPNIKPKFIQEERSRDKLMNEIRKSSNTSLTSPIDKKYSKEDDYIMSTSYVGRRRSEIEARIKCNLAEIDSMVKYRKCSEGSLPFSKMPSNFLFSEDTRYVIFDSKNWHKKKDIDEKKTDESNIANIATACNYENDLFIPSNEFQNKEIHRENNNFLNHLSVILAKKLEQCV